MTLEKFDNSEYIQVSELLNVSSKTFFDEIVRSILEDIQRQTNRKMHASQLKSGLTYKKKISGRSSKNAEVIIKILECVPSKIYSASFTSEIDITTVTYEIEEKEENKICVTYTETFKLLSGKKLRSQSKLHKMYLHKKSEKKSRKLLKHIEEYILMNQDKE